MTSKSLPLWVPFAPLGYLLIAAAISALLAYPIHLFSEGGMPFRTLVTKGALLVLVLSIIPMMRRLNFQAKDLGFAPLQRFLHQIPVGLACGFAILGVLIALLMALGIRVLDPKIALTVPNVSAIFLKALLTGFVVALIEETLFRGLLLSSLLKYMSPVYATFLSAFYYAGLHFLHSEITLPPEQIRWHSGFSIVLDAFRQGLDGQNLDSFLALFFVGVFLACVRLTWKTSLGYCIGLHASWVFLIKITKALTNIDPGAQGAFLVGDYDGIIGYLAAGWLLTLTLVLLYKTSWVMHAQNSDRKHTEG